MQTPHEAYQDKLRNMTKKQLLAEWKTRQEGGYWDEPRGTNEALLPFCKQEMLRRKLLK